MGDMVTRDILLLTALAGVLLLWAAIAFFLWRRARTQTARLERLQQRVKFSETLIAIQHRRPIWVWQDGRIELPRDTRNLIGLIDMPARVQDLFPGGDAGLPPAIQAPLLGGHVAVQPVAGTPVRPALLIECQKLASGSVNGHAGPDGPATDPDWPDAVWWVSEVDSRDVTTGEGPAMADYRLRELRMRFDFYPHPVWVRDRNMALVEVNHAYADAVDARDPADAAQQGRELFDRAPTKAAEKALETGSTVRERQFAVAAGQRRAFAVTHTPMGSSRVLGVAVDVTGEEEALSELSRVLESQSETLNRLRTPVAIFGPGKTLRFYNSAFQRLSGLSEETLDSGIAHGELLDAMHDRRRLPEQADFPAWKRASLEQYTRLIEPEEEMWHLPNGSTYRVVTQPHPLGGLLVLFEDVTDRLALERSYNTLIAVQQETLDNISEAVAVFGADGRVQLANPAFATLWQCPPEILKSTPHLSDLLTHLAIDDKAEGDERLLLNDLPAWVSGRQSHAGRWHRADGKVVDFTLVPLPDGAMMLTQMDVTDSFRIEQALRERSRALEAADRLKSEFVTNMSYGLRTPLNSIIGFAEILKERFFGELNDQQAAYVDDILGAAGDLRDMISNVLDLAVIDAGALALDIDTVDIAVIMREAAELAEGMASKSGIQIVCQVSETPCTVQGDRRRLKQMLYNMISTMMSIGQRGSVINVSFANDDSGVGLTVAAARSDLTPEDRDRLLATLEVGGIPEGSRSTGLDLALVRSIVALHRGRVMLNAVGEDTFSLTSWVPRDPDPEPDPGPDSGRGRGDTPAALPASVTVPQDPA